MTYLEIREAVLRKSAWLFEAGRAWLGPGRYRGATTATTPDIAGLFLFDIAISCAVVMKQLSHSQMPVQMDGNVIFCHYYVVETKLGYNDRRGSRLLFQSSSEHKERASCQKSIVRTFFQPHLVPFTS